ncbi:hypothetical protein Poly21_42980 [Allorhodopirellula heiligendammensis]|uniref:Uncharacterized protein n=2 Tax=Allorhodopirellula heiligendammensis TaxID=2714739 RepID=A0A5C6BZ08_9BACT|nr:hypothetical protein Poly21_42980 [Allorhodopirellula heiligendammensis]
MVVVLPLSLLADDLASPRRDNIKAEVGNLVDHPWAGEYSDSMQGLDMGPSYVWLAPKNGAAYLCEGWMTDSDYGTISVDESVIRIKWENPSRTGRSPTERELILVRYRKYIFLVPKTQIHAFCLAVRGEGKLPMGLLRRVNHAFDPKEPDAIPHVPPQFKPYLDLPPIVTKVTQTDTQTRERIGDDDEVVRQVVTIDVGAEHHVFPGMRFQRKREDEDDAFPMIEVKTVRASESDAELRYYVEPNNKIPQVAVGEAYVTTRW